MLAGSGKAKRGEHTVQGAIAEQGEYNTTGRVRMLDIGLRLNVEH